MARAPLPAPAKLLASQSTGHPFAPAPSTITPGDPLSRMMGQYGKGHSYLPPGNGSALGAPAKDPMAVRGGKGGMKRNPRVGGLAPGRMGSVGSETDYTKDLDPS